MTRRALPLLAWLALAAIVFVTVSPIGLRPHDVMPVTIDRALAFAALACLFVTAYPRHWRSVGLAVVFCAVGIEWLQELSPTRHARLDDALIKAVGALFGVAGGRLSILAHDRLRAVPRPTD